MKERERMLLFLCVLIYCIFILNALANSLSLYWIYSWLDMAMHFLGGIWVGLASVWLIYLSGYVRSPAPTPWRVLGVAFGGGLFFGLLWELFEYGLGVVAVSPEEYAIDTAVDLAMDMLGIFVASAYSLRRLRTLPKYESYV